MFHSVHRDLLVAATCKGDQDTAFGQLAVDAAAAQSLDKTWVECKVLSLKGVTSSLTFASGQPEGALSLCRGVWVWAAALNGAALHAEPGQLLPVRVLAGLKKMQVDSELVE